MFFKFFFALLLITSCHFKSIIIEGRSSNSSKCLICGAEVKEGRYNYMASLQDKNGHHFCGGFLIKSNFVLTAAHCGVKLSHRVMLGSVKKHPDNSKYYSIKNIYKYSDNILNGDLLLIELSRHSDITPVKFANTTTNVSSNKRLITLGWGLTEKGYLSENLLKVEMGYLDMNDFKCQKQIKNMVEVTLKNKPESRKDLIEQKWNELYEKNFICAYEHGKSVCHGDSGGPILIEGSDPTKDVVVGISSHLTLLYENEKLKNCLAKDVGRFFTRISTYSSLINKIIKK